MEALFAHDFALFRLVEHDVALVGEEGDADFLLAVLVQLVQPVVAAVEGVGGGHVVDQHGAQGVAVVGDSHGAVALAASRVPELEAHAGAVGEEEQFGDELDADGGGGGAEVAGDEALEDARLAAGGVACDHDLRMKGRNGYF